MKYLKSLITKNNNKSSIIGVIGMGYVGMSISLTFVNAGFKVIGFDTDKKKIQKIKNKKSYISSISSDDINSMMSKGLEVTVNFSKISLVDVIIICVPTPLTRLGNPDLKYLTSSINSIIPHIKEGQLISLESTTYPGTTEEEIVPRLKKNNFKIGKNIFLCYSPEREDPGNKNYSTKIIPKVIGGYSKNCLEAAVSIYSKSIKKIVPVSSIQVAEMTKLHENIHRLVNIGLVNEMKMICDKFNIDIREVIEAAKTKPFGFTPYYPGPGAGGHCVPVDPMYLTWKAKQYSSKTRFISLAQKVNEEMPKWILDKLLKELSFKEKKLNKLKVLFIGVTYKKNINDLRESPSIKLMKLFQKKKALIKYHDPYVQNLKLDIFAKKIKSIKLHAKNIINQDLVVITTDHDDIDYSLIYENSKLILDTRGKYSGIDKKIINA